LQAGGKGLQYLAASGQAGNWSAMYFSGTGEVPINISNNVTFAMQNGMRVTSGSKPVVVKQGQGRFLCFNEGSSDYKLPLVLIRQGAWDMSTKGTIGNTTVAFDGNDVSQRLQFGYSGSWGTGLTLNNSAIIETNGVANTGHGIFDNDRGRQLAFTGTPKVNPMVFSGTFYGGAGLRWSPNAASYVFVCSNAVSATTGKLSVEKGTVKLVTGASFTALSELAVSAGAVFEVEAGSGADFHATGLTLGDATAQLNLGAGVTVAVTSATLKGKALSPGTYAAEAGENVKKAAWITGAGTVTVAEGPAASFTWQGGAAGGNSVYLADNWTDGGEPDLSSGTLLATFAEGGAEAAIPADRAASFSGLILDNATGGNAFAFMAGDGASATVGVNGITAASSAATAWNMQWPLVFAGAQTLALGANDTLTLAGGFAGADALTVDGAGTLVLSAPATHTGALDFKKGTVRALASGALGAGSRTVTFDFNNTTLSIGGTDTVIPCALNGGNTGSDTSLKGLTVEADSHVTFQKQVYLIADHMFKVEAGATAVLAGNYRSGSTGMNGHMSVRGSGTIVVTNGTIYLPFAIYTPSGDKVDFEFWSTGNRFNANRYYNWSTFSGRLTTRVANALDSNNWIQLSSNQAVFDLDGHDQSIMWFHACAGSRVTSATPATLTVTSGISAEYQDTTSAGDSNRVDLAVFEGAVNFKKTGPVKHTFGATSTSTGSVTVTQGILLFNASGKWPNATEMKVEGGVLSLKNAEALGTGTVWRVNSSARVELFNAGQTNVCERLYVDGHRKVGGLYGATGSGAPREADWITGPGLLKVAEHGLTVMLK